jgi:hypothetical protein
MLGLWIGCGLDSNGTGESTTSTGTVTTTSTTTSTSTTTTTGMGGEGPGGMGGMGGAGGVGGIGGNGGAGGAPLPVSCEGAVDGPTMIDPDGVGPETPLITVCDQGWALVHNSVKYEGGGGAGGGGESTLAFWNIAYVDRFIVKGEPQITENFYAGVLYKFGTTYREEFEDTLGVAANAAVVTVGGFDPVTMNFMDPIMKMSGIDIIISRHFEYGWASPDVDHDPSSAINCATVYFNVTQHYGDCLEYSLGTLNNTDDDGGWGPHVRSEHLIVMGLTEDDPKMLDISRLNRISRWAQW